MSHTKKITAALSRKQRLVKTAQIALPAVALLGLGSATLATRASLGITTCATQVNTPKIALTDIVNSNIGTYWGVFTTYTGCDKQNAGFGGGCQSCAGCTVNCFGGTQ